MRSRILFGLCLALLAAPAFAQPESCVGKARIRGPLFDTTAGRLEPGLEVVLDDIARTILERCGSKDIVIEGHAYELASPELNRALAELRIQLVRHELAKRGIPIGRLMPVSLGDTRPIIPLDQAGAALENRRITFRPLD